MENLTTPKVVLDPPPRTVRFPPPSGVSALFLRALFPLTAFKSTPNPKFVQNLSQRLFLGVPPVWGSGMSQKFVKICLKLWFFSNFDQIFVTNFRSPAWGPKNNRWDKSGVRGAFKCCKGKKGSQLCFSCTKIHDRVDKKLFWRGPKVFGRARSLDHFSSPHTFCPPPPPLYHGPKSAQVESTQPKDPVILKILRSY